MQEMRRVGRRAGGCRGMKDTSLGSIRKQKVGWGGVHYRDEKEGKRLKVNDNLQWEMKEVVDHEKDSPAISRFSQTSRSQEKVRGTNLAHYGQ